MDKKLLLITTILSAILMNSLLKSQTTLQTVDFETTTGYTVTGGQTTSSDDWWGRATSAQVNPTAPFTGYQGSYFFYAEDTDNGRTADDPCYVTLNSITATGYENFQIKLLVAGKNDIGSGLEMEEYLRIQYEFNGGGFTTLAQYIPSEMNVAYYTEDANADGTTDGANLNPAFTEFTYSIPGIGTSLQIRLMGSNDQGNEEFGFDNIRVLATEIVPVELTSFKAEVQGNNVELNWQTATEVNNYGFEIERTYSRKTEWGKIAFLQGYGNSNSTKDYSFIDKPVGGNEFRYRLKQIDLDGSFKYSKEVNVKLEASSDFSVKQNFPNPFNPTTRIEYAIPLDNNVEIKVFNVLGMEVATLLNEYKQAGIHSIEFNASNLSSGIYFCKVVSSNYSEIKKMILQR